MTGEIFNKYSIFCLSPFACRQFPQWQDQTLRLGVVGRLGAVWAISAFF